MPALVSASTLSYARPLPVSPRGRDGGEVASFVWLRQEEGSQSTLAWALVWCARPRWALVVWAIVNPMNCGPRGLLIIQCLETSGVRTSTVPKLGFV
jgi:hypothetical protein